MKASSHSFIRPRSLAQFVAVSGLFVAAAFGVAGSAKAEVIWSVGVHEPGVNVRVSNAPQRPVVIAQPPVVVTHPVVYYPAPRPVVQQVVYVEPRHHHPRGNAHGYWRKHKEYEHEHRYGHGHRKHDHARY